MDVDYERLNKAVAATIREIRDGSKDPVRHPRARINVVRDLQGEVTAGPFRFRTDAALDAGGFGQHPRPMDYLLGALVSCQQMWCLRWAAQGKTAQDIADILGRSLATICLHLNNATRKLDAQNRAQAVAHAFHYRLFDSLH